MKVRLFIAIPIPDQVKERLISCVKLTDSYRTVKFGNLHITVLFLGDTEEDRIGLICEILEKVVKKYNKFEIDISEFGQFPSSGSGRIIYAAGTKNLDLLINFSSDIRAGCSKLGFYDDKDFRYHITVARAKDNLIKDNIELKIDDKLFFDVEEVALYKSILTKKGPVYEKVFSTDLNY